MGEDQAADSHRAVLVSGATVDQGPADRLQGEGDAEDEHARTTETTYARARVFRGARRTRAGLPVGSRGIRIMWANPVRRKKCEVVCAKISWHNDWRRRDTR